MEIQISGKKYIKNRIKQSIWIFFYKNIHNINNFEVKKSVYKTVNEEWYYSVKSMYIDVCLPFPYLLIVSLST